jgi:hypothetical protein
VPINFSSPGEEQSAHRRPFQALKNIYPQIYRSLIQILHFLQLNGTIRVCQCKLRFILLS